MAASRGPRVIALIAGEDSGDLLGAELITALRARYPELRLFGIGGPRMRAAGFEAWHDIAELSVMGVAEVLRHLPRLLRLRAGLTRRLLAAQPDVCIGIDAPDFNLGLERKLKRAGIPTVHYVSPSVWAWRAGRAKTIGQSADLVLCLFPMEPPCYAAHAVAARFVGHPLADRFPLIADGAAARRELGLAEGEPVLAVLPGSRGSEIKRLGAIFFDAAARVATEIPGLRVVIPAANPRCHARITQLVANSQLNHPDLHAAKPLILDGHAHTALLAADVVLLASGTAALEGLLAKRPMVVGYRIAALTHALVKGLGLLKTRYYSLPNVLAGQPLVPELMQDDCTPARISAAVLRWFGDARQRESLVHEATRIHRSLQAPGGGATAAVTAIAELLDRNATPTTP